MDIISIYYTQLNPEFTEDKFAVLLSQLPNKLQQQIIRINHEQTRYSKLLGLLLLSTALEDFGYSTQLLSTMEYGDHGKPFIPNAFEFNIAHSGSIIICAISKTQIGVDIEQIRPVSFENFTSNLTTPEIQMLERTNDSNDLFFDIWTKKEAFSKALGLGMTIPFSHVILDGHKISYKNETMYSHSIDLKKGYSACVCSPVQNLQIDRRKVLI
jgi:4'-phosphopantetheinyl transferase